MRWDQAGSAAMRFARSIHDKYGASVDSPIDIFGIVRAAGIVLAFRPMSGKVSATLVREGKAAGIVVNSNHPLSRQRYSVAHELGHYEFGHKSTIDCGDALDRRDNLDDQEKLAESFAAWFLMPYPLVLGTVRRMGLKTVSRAEDVYQISLRLGASFEATALQLRNQQLLSAAAQRTLAKLAPATLKRSVYGVDAPSDLRSDLWHMGMPDNGKTYITRPGDRIVLDVPEVPTSGRLWTNETHDDLAISLRGETYDVVESDLLTEAVSDTAGSSIVKRFTFDLVNGPTQQAAATIELLNKTPWRDDASAERFSLQIQIESQRTGFDQSIFAMAG